MKITFRPFISPHYALEGLSPHPGEAGFTTISARSIRDIDAETLSQMCDDFRADVFRKAGKADPTPKGTT